MYGKGARTSGGIAKHLSAALDVCAEAQEMPDELDEVPAADDE